MNEKLEDPLVQHSNPEAPLQLGRKIVVVIAVKTFETSPKSLIMSQFIIFNQAHIIEISSDPMCRSVGPLFVQSYHLFAEFWWHYIRSPIGTEIWTGPESDLYWTGSKDCKKLQSVVFLWSGSVFLASGKRQTSYSYGWGPSASKNQTGLDFQTLVSELSQLSPCLTFLKRKDDALWEDIL